MSKRVLKDWITAYLEYVEDTEPPRSYHLWTAISCIAGAMQRKTYFTWGFEKIYPNLYVILVGPAGKTRKGTAMNLGMDIFKELRLPTSAEKITREQLIKKLKEAVRTFSENVDGQKQPKIHCSLTAFSKELSVFLGQRDIDFLALLTDWYDCHDNWKYETKNSGKFEIKGIFFNLLGATAPDWLQSMLPVEAIGGGFTSRCIFVCEWEKGKIIPEPEVTEDMLKLRGALVADLQRIMLLKGNFEFSKESRKEYVKWYKLQDSMIRKGKAPIRDGRFGAYCERRATLIKKLGMIMSASRTTAGVIDIIDFNRARAIMETTERNMATVFGGLGHATTGNATYMVLEYISKRGTVNKSEVMEFFYQDIDLTTLDIVERTLEVMKAITIKHDKAEVIYTLRKPSGQTKTATKSQSGSSNSN